jgi:DNA repair ATPase RecN
MDEFTDQVTESEEELKEDVESVQEESEEIESIEEESEEESEDGESLPFAKAEVVRLMKKNLSRDKLIRERVKVEMNRFLGEVLEKVCEQLNEYPYTTIEYEMLTESIYPYKNIERINEEKRRILMHLDAIKADCDALSMDVKKSLKLKDVDEEDEF